LTPQICERFDAFQTEAKLKEMEFQQFKSTHLSSLSDATSIHSTLETDNIQLREKLQEKEKETLSLRSKISQLEETRISDQSQYRSHLEDISKQLSVVTSQRSEAMAEVQTLKKELEITKNDVQSLHLELEKRFSLSYIHKDVRRSFCLKTNSYFPHLSLY
jgi:hypothetical protein